MPVQPRACVQGYDLVYVVGMYCVEILHTSAAAGSSRFCGVVGELWRVVQSSATSVVIICSRLYDLHLVAARVG